MQTLTATQLKARIDNGDMPVLLDVREDWEYDICHLPDSLNISMGNTQQMLEQLSHAAETVVICHHGIRSYQVACYLEQNGFSNIINLEGGVDAWAKTVDSNMPKY